MTTANEIVTRILLRLDEARLENTSETDFGVGYRMGLLAAQNIVSKVSEDAVIADEAAAR